MYPTPSYLTSNTPYLAKIATNQLASFQIVCGNFPQQRINTESIAAKLTHFPTATDKHRFRCYEANTHSHSDGQTRDKIGTVGEGDS
jgi:hypothetical protein